MQEFERARARSSVFLNDFGAGDVGRHQIGRELDAAEFERQRFGQRADQQRFRQARHADQQAMAAGEHGDEQLFDHFCCPTMTFDNSAAMRR